MPLIALFVVSLAAGVLGAFVVSRDPFRALANEPPSGFGAVLALKAAAGRNGIKRRLALTSHRRAAASLAFCAAVTVFIVGWICAGALALLIRENSAAALNIDSGVAEWGYQNASRLSQGVIVVVTFLGDTLIVVGLAAILLIIEFGRRRSPAILLFIVAIVVGDAAVTLGAKLLMNRARPTLNPITSTLGPSFPSGHASMAAAFFPAAALLLSQGRGRRATALLGGLAVGIAVAVAATRVLLDVHWLSDAIAGLAVGWAWFAFCVLAFDGSLRFSPRKRPAEAPSR
jgi:membrane-associated phospholipid phosphatase